MSLGYRYLTEAACQHLVQFREHRPRHGLKDKELIDQWIHLHSADQFKDDVFFLGILGMHDVQSDQVLCQVRCVTTPVSVILPSQYILFSPLALDSTASCRLSRRGQSSSIHHCNNTTLLWPNPRSTGQPHRYTRLLLWFQRPSGCTNVDPHDSGDEFPNATGHGC